MGSALAGRGNGPYRCHFNDQLCACLPHCPPIVSMERSIACRCAAQQLEMGPMASKSHRATRHIISINDFSDQDIETVFDTAQAFLDELPVPHIPYRIGRSTRIASNSIL